MDLSPASLTALRAHVNLLEFCPQDPEPPQSEMVADDRLELFFGGRAGGGKSSALLMSFLKYVHVPRYSGLILRRTFADLALPGAIMSRAQEWFLSRGVKWNERDHKATFPSGATLTFGYADSANDHLRYQGSEFQFVGFDELTQFDLPQYLYLFSRLRRTGGIGVPLRMRATGNPGGRGHEWVKRRLIDDTTREPGARYIPAGVDDNPHVTDDYKQSLDKLDPVTRAQLKDGDWDVTASGNTFKREWWGIVEEAPPNLRMVTRRWDIAATEPRPGFTDPDYLASCKGGVLGFDDDAVFYVLHATEDRRSPAGVVDYMKSVAVTDGHGVRVRVEREPGSNSTVLADQLARGPFKGFDFMAMPSTTNKLARARPLSAAADKGKVFLVRGPWNEWWIDRMASFPTKGVHDDTPDAASGCFLDVTGGAAPSTSRIVTGLPRVTTGLGGGKRGAMWR